LRKKKKRFDELKKRKKIEGNKKVEFCGGNDD
jgi:hypothetical protein